MEKPNRDKPWFMWLVGDMDKQEFYYWLGRPWHIGIPPLKIHEMRRYFCRVHGIEIDYTSFLYLLSLARRWNRRKSNRAPINWVGIFCRDCGLACDACRCTKEICGERMKSGILARILEEMKYPPEKGGNTARGIPTCLYRQLISLICKEIKLKTKYCSDCAMI